MFPSVSHTISKDQSSLSVSVVDLHCLAGVQGVDVIRTGGIGTNGILSETKQGMEVLFKSLKGIAERE